MKGGQFGARTTLGRDAASSRAKLCKSLAVVPRARALFLLLVVWGCGTPASAPDAARATQAPTALPQKSLAPQGTYCERLQPLLDKSTSAAELGVELRCLDMPGITELGRFGTGEAAEQDSLAHCFARPEDYAKLIETPSAGVELTIEDEFVSDERAEASARLSDLVPWLPKVSVGADQKRTLRASVGIRDARFVTLVGVATKIQGQPREQECLRALCEADATYVQKALVGTPHVTVTALDEQGREASIGALVASVGFAERDIGRGRREFSSKAPVTLAIARASFRTKQTERLCQFCGKQGQACCADGTACDGGLGCVGGRCVETGGPNQPCDSGSCRAGASCVDDRCELDCGEKGETCCPGKRCGGKLRCADNPKNALEHRTTRETVTVEGGFFGTDEDRAFGSASCGPLFERKRYAVTKLGSGRGNCERVWWFDPKNQRDCRASAHFDVSPFASITCQLEVFATAPPEPNLCLP